MASSSWALSQTVTTRSAGSRTSSDVAGRCGHQGEVSAAGDGDRAGMHPRCGVGARGGGRDRAVVVPHRGGQLRAGRVVGAHEHHPLAPPGRPAGLQEVEDVAVERDVAAAAVAFGPVPGQQPGLFEHAQVMGQQVRRHPEPGGQLSRRRLTPGQGVDDREPSGIAERGMQRRPPHHIELASVDIESIFVEACAGCQPARVAGWAHPVSAASVSRSGARSCEADRRASGRIR